MKKDQLCSRLLPSSQGQPRSQPPSRGRSRLLLAVVSALVLLALLAGVGGAQVSDHYALWWYSLHGSGGAAAGSNHVLVSTLGQPLAGQADSAHFRLALGFVPVWLPDVTYPVYLPLLLRGQF
jgi:hypothetical protein